MKVVMFCPQFRPIIGGSERQAEKLAVELVKRGCRVMVVTPHIQPNLPDQEEFDGVRVERFPLLDLSRRYPVPGVALVNIPWILWQVVRALKPRLKGADILHCHIASLTTAGAALAGRLAGVSVLCKAAVADHRSDLGEIEKSGVSGSLVAWIARRMIDTWVATTSPVERALIRAGVQPDKIVSIPNGVSLTSGPNARLPRNHVRRILYLGRLSSNIRRDIPTLIEAFKRLAQLNSEIELAIVGGGDLLDDSRRLAAAGTMSERIHLAGFDRPEKWLQWADAFVLPSRREGLSNALLEAMAAGLPCIANDIEPNREVLADGQAGILVPVEDIDALQEAMRKLVENNQLARHFGAKARQRAQNCYSIQAVGQSYVQLYHRLCQRKKRG